MKEIFKYLAALTLAFLILYVFFAMITLVEIILNIY